MKLQGNTYTFVFALIICVVCSFSLALVSEGLRERKELNRSLDIKKNILKAVSLRDPLASDAAPQKILDVYAQKIDEMVITADGQVVEGRSPEDIREGEALYPMYIYKEDGQVLAYAFPVIGKGLWSTLRGYFALEPDAVTVRGITFYEHGETPGLGAEIEKEWFQHNFVGKKVWDVQGNVLVPIRIVKGKVADSIPQDKAVHYVDGISGATMTSKGVTEMIEKELNKYEPFFSQIRS